MFRSSSICRLFIYLATFSVRLMKKSLLGVGGGGRLREKRSFRPGFFRATWESVVKRYYCSVSQQLSTDVHSRRWVLGVVFVCRTSCFLNRAKALHLAVYHPWGKGAKRLQSCPNPRRTCLRSVCLTRSAVCFSLVFVLLNNDHECISDVWL